MLSNKLYKRCRDTLLKCEEFETDDRLRAMFVAELRPFHNQLPVAPNKAARVDGCLALLLDSRLSDGRLALIPFLEILRDKYLPGNALRDELYSLYEDVQAYMSQEENIPATILIPAGSFWMGSPSDDPENQSAEELSRILDLPVYSIGRYPVTNAEYARFLAENPSYPVPHSDEDLARPYIWDKHKRTYPQGKADHPVVLVSWEDANAYCRWLSRVTGAHYRLPTEEEWEKAARGGLPETRCYPWGDEWKPNACNTSELDQGGTTPVHAFEKNPSPYGVVDMAGNVWEWTGSPYQSEELGQCYIVRGGSWQHPRKMARISCRGRYPPAVKRPYLGFRIAKTES